MATHDADQARLRLIQQVLRLPTEQLDEAERFFAAAACLVGGTERELRLARDAAAVAPQAIPKKLRPAKKRSA